MVYVGVVLESTSTQPPKPFSRTPSTVFEITRRGERCPKGNPAAAPTQHQHTRALTHSHAGGGHGGDCRLCLFFFRQESGEKWGHSARGATAVRRGKERERERRIVRRGAGRGRGKGRAAAGSENWFVGLLHRGPCGAGAWRGAARRGGLNAYVPLSFAPVGGLAVPLVAVSRSVSTGLCFSNHCITL